MQLKLIIFLVCKGDRASCLDFKVVLGIEMPTQHRLLENQRKEGQVQG